MMLTINCICYTVIGRRLCMSICMRRLLGLLRHRRYRLVLYSFFLLRYYTIIIDLNKYILYFYIIDILLIIYIYQYIPIIHKKHNQFIYLFLFYLFPSLNNNKHELSYVNMLLIYFLIVLYFIILCLRCIASSFWFRKCLNTFYFYFILLLLPLF